MCQKKFAKQLCVLAGVSKEVPASLNDIVKFEDL